jgi:hypothetical protein
VGSSTLWSHASRPWPGCWSRPSRTCWPTSAFPRPTAARYAARTRWSGSTRRSSAGLRSWASSPTGQRSSRLVGMILAEQDDEWQDGRRCFRPETMALIDSVVEGKEANPALMMTSWAIRHEELSHTSLDLTVALPWNRKGARLLGLLTPRSPVSRSGSVAGCRSSRCSRLAWSRWGGTGPGPRGRSLSRLR